MDIAASLLRNVRNEASPFVLLFVDNCCALVGLIGALTTLALNGLAEGALYSKFCNEAGSTMLPPWPPAVECYAPADLDSIIYGRVVIGLATAMVLGNLYFAWMGQRISMDTGRDDVCCLPYGLNLPAGFAFIAGVMLTVGNEILMKDQERVQSYIETRELLEAPLPMQPDELAKYVWQAGCVANCISGLITILCGCLGELLVKASPRASLLVSLAGISVTCLGVWQLKMVFASSALGFLPLLAMIILFFGGVDCKCVPHGVVVVFVGIVAAWSGGDGWEGGGPMAAVQDALDNVQFYYPVPTFGFDWNLIGQVLTTHLAVVLPIAFTGAIGSLTNIYAAKEGDDEFPIRETMIVEGFLNFFGGCIGSPLTLSIHSGHAALKARGGTTFYSYMHVVCFALMATLGLFQVVVAAIPPVAICPIIILAGLSASKDAFHVVPRRHIPAVTVALFPVVCDWGMKVLAPTNVDADKRDSLRVVRGLFGMGNLSKGSLLVGVLWVSVLVRAIDRRFFEAALWALLAAFLASFGLIHQDDAFSPINWDSLANWDSLFNDKLWSDPMGSAAASFVAAYASAAAALAALGLLRSLGRTCGYCEGESSPIPQPQWDEEEAKSAVEQATILARGRTLMLDSREPLLRKTPVPAGNLRQPPPPPRIGSAGGIEMMGVGTETARAPDQQAIDLQKVENLAKLYEEHEGIPSAVCAAVGCCDLALLRKYKPLHGKDFARKLLAGVYTAMPSESEAKRPMHSTNDERRPTPTPEVLQAARSQLKHTFTKESDSDPRPSAVAAEGWIYTENGGDLGKIASALGITPKLIRSHPPLDAADFGRKLLMGVYDEK